MPRRTTPLVAGNYYHLYNRGSNRQKIFFERENYRFFLQQVRHYFSPKSSEVAETSELSAGISIIAYCFMPNHYHFLVQPHDDNLSHKMQLLSISYTKAVNKVYQRVGPLFQGQFQARHIDRDEYLLHLSRYIHLNPVVAGLVSRPELWEFSSYQDYIGQRRGTLPQTALILRHFPDREAYRRFVVSEAALAPIAHLLFNED